MTSLGMAPLRAGIALALLGSLATAQGTRSTQSDAPLRHLVCDEASLVADPKLAGGDARLAFHLEPAETKAVVFAEVRAGGKLVRKLWRGVLTGGAEATKIQWNGRDDQGMRCPTGAYELHVSAPGISEVAMPLHLVRLGVTEIEAQDGPAEGVDEFPMVYFRKGTAYQFFATP